MTDADISSQLAQYIARDILKQPKRQISGDAPLISNGTIDSFHLVDLALFIEDQYNVHLEDTELSADTFDTVGQLVALIETRLAK